MDPTAESSWSPPRVTDLSAGPSANGHSVTAGLDRATLEAQLAAARQRIAVAQDRARRRELEARQAMRSEVEEMRRRVSELEARHRAAVDLIEQAAEFEIVRALHQNGETLAVAGGTDGESADSDGVAQRVG